MDEVTFGSRCRIFERTPSLISPVSAGQFFTSTATILGSTLVFLDSTIVNVLLPALRHGFSLTLGQAQWVSQVSSRCSDELNAVQLKASRASASSAPPPNRPAIAPPMSPLSRGRRPTGRA